MKVKVISPLWDNSGKPTAQIIGELEQSGNLEEDNDDDGNDDDDDKDEVDDDNDQVEGDEVSATGGFPSVVQEKPVEGPG